MARYALVDSTGGDSVVRLRDFDAAPVDPAGKPHYRWLPYRVEVPVYDPETQLIENNRDDIEASEVVNRWDVRNKTAQEIDDEKTGLVDAKETDKVIFKTLFDIVNEIRALKSQPAIDVAQFKTYLKGLL